MWRGLREWTEVRVDSILGVTGVGGGCHLMRWRSVRLAKDRTKAATGNRRGECLKFKPVGIECTDCVYSKRRPPELDIVVVNPLDWLSQPRRRQQRRLPLWTLVCPHSFSLLIYDWGASHASIRS